MCRGHGWEARETGEAIAEVTSVSIERANATQKKGYLGGKSHVRDDPLDLGKDKELRRAHWLSSGDD